MGILRTLALALALPACYSPDIRDCARSCAADTDCVTSQVCTADHFCASPGLGTSCTDLRDATVLDTAPPHDAHVADATPDAWPTVPLMIHIDGSGMVALTGGGTCNQTDCTMQVPKGVPATVTATGHGDHPFDKWTSTTCMNQPAVCAFTPTMATSIAAKFK